MSETEIVLVCSHCWGPSSDCECEGSEEISRQEGVIRLLEHSLEIIENTGDEAGDLIKKFSANVFERAINFLCEDE